jgi:hypothetical protein
MRPKLRTLGTSILIALSGILASAQALAQLSAQRSTDLPQGWYVYGDEKLRNASASDTRCFNYSRRDWHVTVERGEAHITERRKDQLETSTLPSRLIRQQGMTRLRSATRLNDEWLLAYNGGEFGGGLWLTNEDGSEAKRVFNEDVSAVVVLEKGVLILSGLNHMGLDEGAALVYSLPHSMNLTLQESIKLDGTPSAFAQEGDGSVVFVTTHSLCRITKDGELKILHTFPRWIAQQYPNAIAITADGSIYVGMRMFVLKLNERGDEYSESWLLPNDCRKFHVEMGKIDCACTQ